MQLVHTCLLDRHGQHAIALIVNVLPYEVDATCSKAPRSAAGQKKLVEPSAAVYMLTWCSGEQCWLSTKPLSKTLPQGLVPCRCSLQLCKSASVRAWLKV